MNEKKRITIIFSIIFAGVFLYISSYPLLLPVLEKSQLNKLGYFIYEPVELLRNNSLLFWKVTENCYKLCGGRTYSISRFYSEESVRRYAHWYDNGQIQMDIFYRGKEYLRTKHWRENGVLLVQSEYNNKGEQIKWFLQNGKGIKTHILDLDFKGNGTEKWYDDSGKEIASITVRDFYCPLNGSALTRPTKSDDGNTVQYLQFYKDGKLVDEKIYSPKPKQ
jgi:hypothetical protein